MNKDQLTPPLLQYMVATKPNPITTSTDNNPTPASIIITVLPDITVKCQYLSVMVSVGVEASELYVKDPAPTASTTNSDWAISNSTVIGMGQDAGDNFQVFLFKHIAEDMSVDSSITITVKGIVNQKTGKASIQVREMSCKEAESDFQVRGKAFDITKTGEENFYLNNVIMIYKDTPGSPIALPDKSRPVQLKWQSNGQYYRVYSGSQTDPVHEGTDPWYNIDAGLVSDTAYIIEATAGDQILYQEYFAQINTPYAQFEKVTAKVLTCQAGFFSNGINSDGNSSFDTANVTTLTTSGNADLSKGTVTAFGSETLLTTGVYIPPRTFQALSDGFVIATAAATYPPIDNGSIYLASVQYENQFYYASSVQTNIGYGCNSVTVPIRKGGIFSIQADKQDGASNTNGRASFSWFGLGNGLPQETSQNGGQLFEKAKTDAKAYNNIRQLNALNFISTLESAFEKTIQEDIKEQLIDHLLKL